LQLFIGMPEVQAAQQKHDPELLISFQSSSHLQFTVDVARLFPEMTHHAKRLRGAIPFAYASRTIRLALPGIIRRGLRLFVILVRNNGFRSRYFTSINVQLDVRRKGFLGWSIDVGRDRHPARRRGKARESIVVESVVEVMCAGMVRSCQMA
jgi:hypothetical protein